jgi:hypothetical protein
MDDERGSAAWSRPSRCVWQSTRRWRKNFGKEEEEKEEKETKREKQSFEFAVASKFFNISFRESVLTEKLMFFKW